MQRASRYREAVFGIRQGRERVPIEPSTQFGSMAVENCNELIVFDCSQALIDVHFTHQAEVCQQLPNSNIRGQLHDLGKHTECLVL